MEWPPNPLLLFTSWIMGQISNAEFIELSRIWKEKQKEEKKAGNKVKL